MLDAEHVVAEIRELGGLVRGVVRLASTEGFAIDLLPEAIAAFRERHTGIRFELTVSAPASVVRAVQDGSADIGLTFSIAPTPGVKVEQMAIARTLAVMVPGHPLAARPFVTLGDMAPYPVALPTANTTVRQILDLACAREGVSLNVVLNSTYIAALRRFVELGDAIGVFAEISLRSRLALGNLVAIPIRSAGLDERQVQVQTMIGRTLPHTVRAFLDHLIDYMRK
jgi:DNA-binding transcriptional LysR family regulator